MIKTICVLALMGVVASCTLVNNQYTSQLQELDSQLDSQPQMVWDSLKNMNPEEFSESQKAYYYLLSVSATDKNLVYLENDSTLRVALEYFQDHKDYYNLARSQYYLGKYIYNKQKHKEAYELFKEAESNLNHCKSNDLHLYGLIYYQLARSQAKQGFLKESEILSQQAYDIFTQIGDTVSAAYALKTKGIAQIDNKNFNEAKNNLFKSLEIISNIKDQSNKFYEAKRSILFSISLFYKQIDSLSQSLKYGKECLSLFQKEKKEIPSQHYCNVLFTFYRQQKFDSTRVYCNSMIRSAQQNNNTVNLINGYRILSILEEKSGNYKEVCQLKNISNRLKDSLNNVRNKINLLEVEKRYNNAESQRLILKAENEALKAYITIPFIILCFIIIGLLIYNRHKKLKIKYDRLSEMIKHTEWGFMVTKEFITENHIAYDELERMLNREKGLNNINSDLYNKFHEALIQQKANYSGRLFDRLTDFDGNFGKKFQQLFPEFSIDELLMASMIHHQWKITDMTTIFHTSIDAIRKRKNRLSHKISAKLKKEIDLDEYLTNL